MQTRIVDAYSPFKLSLYWGYSQQRREGIFILIQDSRLYLIEYGVGFFVEIGAKEAIDFYQRKIMLIKEKTTKLQELINEKRECAKACEAKIMQHLQVQQAQQAQTVQWNDSVSELLYKYSLRLTVFYFEQKCQIVEIKVIKYIRAN